MGVLTAGILWVLAATAFGGVHEPIAPLLPAPLPSGVRSQGPLSKPASSPAVDVPADILAKITDLDRALVADDRKALLALSAGAPCNDSLCWLRRAEALLEWFDVTEQRTEPHHVATIGDATAVYVKVYQSRRCRGGKNSAEETAVEPRVLMFRRTQQGLVLVRVESWSGGHLKWISGERIACSPCGWQMKRPEGWFVVPHTAAAGGAFDSVSFVHSDLSVSLDVDCLVVPKTESPLETATRDEEMAASAEGASHAAAVKQIRREESVEKLTGASVDGLRATLISDVATQEGGSARHWRVYRAFPPFLFVQVAHGPSKDVAQLEPQIQLLLDSLALDGRIVGSRDQALKVASAHMRDSEVGNGELRCKSQKFAVNVPEGWHALPRPGVGRFCWTFQHPDHADVSITIVARETEGADWTEPDVRSFLDARRESIAAWAKAEPKVLRDTRRKHEKSGELLYEVESEWKEGGTAGVVRERIHLIPVGSMLLCIVIRAPQAKFSAHVETLERIVASYHRNK